MSVSTFLNGRVVLHAGDCLDRIRDIPDASIDSVVTDPPYALVSITKRFGKLGSAACIVPEGRSGAYARASAGFMGKAWDTGDRAFAVEFWAEVYRVLKPGGHVLAFGGTRTVHRLTCAIEDAGFEIRDMVAWLYGSGFPKSHDVSKGLDRRGGASVGWFGPWLKAWRSENGIAQKDVAALFPSKTGGKTGCVANWELGLNMPTPEQFNLICTTFGLSFESIEQAEREVVGQRLTGIGTGTGSVPIMGDGCRDVTAASSEAARQWEGWGTALKPALEPITFARKPLAGTVAENVLAHGTGALNIAGCRIGTEGGGQNGRAFGALNRDEWRQPPVAKSGVPLGRWPANLIHDGSDEVIAAFPETTATGVRSAQSQARWTGGQSTLPGQGGTNCKSTEYSGDSGSAARFFYNAKADSDDRIGSKHPTVKPVDLMRYLVRLVTPPGGTVLDPFAGTGTTGEAAYREGFSAVLIEREDEYRADIARRMALVLAGPDERRHAIIKAKGKPVDLTGTLFAEAAE